MEKSNSFMTDDGEIFDVPESKLDAFSKDAQKQGIALRSVKKYADPEGSIFDVPEDKHDAFMQDAQAQGVQLEEVNSVHTLGGTFDVPKSKARAFHDEWMNDAEADKEREDTASTIVSKLDAPDSPLWAGFKGFFSPSGYAANATPEGYSATAANVFRGVAQAPATIADKVGAAEQFGSRVRELPGAKTAMVTLAPMMPTALAGLGWEAILSLKGKDGGKEYRALIQKARDYVDAKREEYLGYRNEKGEKATADDFAMTLGGQAVNSVAESYLLTAPKVMQGINGAMRAGGAGLVSRLTPTLQTMLYGASTAEGTASKAEDKGMSNEKAVGLGLLTGTIESALESVSQVTGLQDAISKSALKKAVARTVWKKAGEVLKDATGEGLTEFGQQFQQGAIEKLSKIDEKTWSQIGMESASAAALGVISGGASASANGVFDSSAIIHNGGNNPAIMQGSSNDGGTDEKVRMEQEAQAVGEGERAARESVLEGEAAQGQAGEGAGAEATVDQPGHDTGGGVRAEGDLTRDPAVAGEPMRGNQEPLMIGDGVIAEPVETSLPVKAGEQPRTAQQVRIKLPNGKALYSNDPGLMALVQYWYKDRVLFPPSPAGDRGAQEGDTQMNASRRAGFEVKPAKRVWVNNLGRSSKGYMGTVVQVLDNNTVRVRIDKTQRSLKNNKQGYRDVDVRTLAQLPSVVAKQERAKLTQGMTKDQTDKIDADAKAFEQEIIDAGMFINQEEWTAAEAMGDTKRGKMMKSQLVKDAYRRAESMMGIPLENHVQRAKALPLLTEFHATMQGSEGMPYDAWVNQEAQLAEQDMADRRASGEFSLQDMTPEEMAQADANLQAQRDAAAQRAEIMRRAQAPITGTTGDMTGIIPGMEDFTFDDTPLFGFDNGNSKLETGNLVDTGEELPFNMAPEGDQTNTQPFKKWFNGSKVVNENGNPKIVYHGTRFDFSVFDKNMLGNNTSHPTSKLGFFFTDNKEVASSFTNTKYKEREKIIPVFLSIKNPLVITWDQWINSARHSSSQEGLKDLNRKIVEGNHDGLMLPAQPDRAPEYAGDTWIAFNPSQVKSASDNVGTFDPSNPDIRYNVAPEAAGVYNQDTSGGADTPRAQEQAAEKTPINTPPWMQERNAVGMDLMDAVSMVYQLTGKFPKVMEKLRKTRALGYFDPNTKEVVLWAKIFGLVDDQDRARIRKALEAKGFEGEKLFAQEAVEVKALMEKRRKEHQKRPLKVAVHELAHLVDFLPDGTIKRGNILGHVAALSRYLKQAIGPEPGAQGPLSEKEKADLRRRAEKEMKDLLGEARTVIEEVIREVPEYRILGITPDDVKGLLGMDSRTATPELYDWFSRQESDVKREVLKAAMQGVVDERMSAFARKEQVGTRTVREQMQRDVPGYTKEDGRKRFRELLREETERRRLIELKRIKEEARAIIPWWRGVESMEDYFEQPAEMYAELMGIFLADPSELQRRAPTVFRAFMGYMEARPEVADAYRAFLDARNMPADKQAAMKIDALKRGMTEEDEKSRREADEMARKPGKWAAKDSFMYFFHRKSAPTKAALDRSLKTLLAGVQSEAERDRLTALYESALVSIKKQSAVGRVIQQYEMEVNEQVAKPLDRMGLDMLDLGVYQALRRVVYELDGKAAPAGVEPASALKLLTAIEEQYGPEKWEAFQKLAMEFRRIREQRIIQNPDLRAMFDKELLEKLDNNVEYVTFKHVPTMQQINEFKDAIRRAKSGNKLLREDVAEFLTGELDNRLGSSVGAKIHRYVGSFGPVANPIVATLSKDEQLIKSATRNTLRKQVYEFVKESGLDLIRDVQYEKNGRGMMVPKMVDDANWKTVVYMEDGQVKGYLANRWLAKSLETGISEDVVALNKVLKANAFMTKLYTQLKYSFSFMNNIRDLERAANYIPGMERMRLAPGVNVNVLPFGGLLSTLQRYEAIAMPFKKLFPKLYNDRMIEFYLADARKAAIMIQDGTINQEEQRAQEMMRNGDTRGAEKLLFQVRLAREGLAKPILMSHMEAIREDSTMDDYSRRLYRIGIQKDDIAKGLNVAAHIRGMFKNVGRAVEGWGETGELTTKLATWAYFQKHVKNISEDQKIILTRELGGSPDFSERGRAASYIEFITSPFVNAAKEGTIGAGKAFWDRKAETTAKLFKNVIGPTMIRHMLSSGLAYAIMKIRFGDDEEKKATSWMYQLVEWYYDRTRNVPNYVLKNYHAYPLPFSGLEGSSFSLILRAPMDQTSQMVSLVTWNMMDFIGEQVLQQMNGDGTPVVLSRTERPGLEAMESVISSIGPDALGQAPVLGMLGILEGYIFGTNYFDDFRGMDVFDENDLMARASFSNGAWKNAAMTTARELSNRTVGPMVKRWNKDNMWGETPPTLHQWLNMPVVQPLVGSFLNVYTGGQAQMERKLGRIKKEMEAPIKVEARQDFAKSINESGQRTPSYTDQMLNKMGQSGSPEAAMRGQIYKEEIDGLMNKFYTQDLKRGEVGELMRFSKEKNPIMRDTRSGIMDRNAPSIMSTNTTSIMDPERRR